VIGLTANQAIQKLESAGFVVVVLPHAATFNPITRVVQYSPTGRAPFGSTITVYI
jgi:hypothetical protein